MKMNLLILTVLSVLLSNCSFPNEEIKLKQIWNFKISVERNNQNNTKIRLSGLLSDSSMGISDMKTKFDGDELNIILFKNISNNKYSGKLDEEITIEHSEIKKITYGSEQKIIWQKIIDL